MNVPLRVAENAERLAEEAAREIAATLCAAARPSGRASIALAGGSTPRATYERLARLPPEEAPPWPDVEVFFGDERAVPPEHPDSNYRMAREALLSRVPVRPERVHRMEGERDDLGRAALDYERSILATLGGSREDPPPLDLVLLGVGEDGHTASIFPEVVALCRGPHLVARILSRRHGPRLTMTLPLLCAARRVLFLVAGANKRPILERWRRLPEPRDDLPASLVRPERGDLLVLCDRAAAPA